MGQQMAGGHAHDEDNGHAHAQCGLHLLGHAHEGADAQELGQDKLLTRMAPRAMENRLSNPLLGHLLSLSRLLGLAQEVLHGGDDAGQGQEAAHGEDHAQSHPGLPSGRIRRRLAAVEDAAAKGAVAQELTDHTHDDQGTMV